MENEAVILENMKNNKPILIVFTVLLVIGLIIGAYFLGKNSQDDNDNSSSSSSSNNETSSSSRSDVVSSRSDVVSPTVVFNVDEECGPALKNKICNKTLKIANKDTLMEIVSRANQVDDNRFHYQIMSLNGTKIVEMHDDSISLITIVDDLLIIDVHCTNCGGGSSEIPATLFMNTKGDKIYDLYQLELLKNFEYIKYEVKDNKILFHTSSVGYHGDYEPDVKCFLKGEITGINSYGGKSGVNAQNYDNYASRVVQIVYELPYLGNDKFGDLVKISEKRFNELYTKEFCQNEYEEYVADPFNN